MAEQIFRLDEARRHRILVLEAGPFMLPGHLQNLPLMRAGLTPPPPASLAEMRAEWNAENPGQGVPSLLPPRNEIWGLPWHSRSGPDGGDPQVLRYPGLAYCLGGRSLFWGGWSPRPLDTELSDWPAQVVADLKTRYFAEAARQLGTDIANDFIFGPLHAALRENLFAGMDAIADAIPVASANGLEAPLAVQSAPAVAGFSPFNKFSILPVLMQAARAAQNESGGDDAAKRLMIVPRCHVIALDCATTGLVSGIRTSQGDLQVSPDALVFIALGTIESTRLALNAFPNRTGRIGRNLTSHLRSDTTVRLPRTAFADLPSTLQASALFVKGRRGANGPHFHLEITGAAVQGDIRNAEIQIDQTIPDLDQLDRLTGALAQAGNEFVALTIRGIGEMAADLSGTGGNGIQQDAEPDENGVRRALVTLGPAPTDQDLWAAMEAAAGQAARALAAGAPIEYLNESTGNWQSAQWTRRDGLGTTHDEGGTLWMGTDPAASVTDTLGRFHEVTNAFAVGPALFPVAGSSGPMLGGMALVRRTARSLVALPLAAGSAALDDGFSWLFDGADTTDWQMAGQGGFDLEVRDGGVMTSSGGPGLFWFRGRQFGNFVLRLQWQSNRSGSNSGVFLRFPDPAGDPQVAVDQGYEVQIDDLGQPDNAPVHRTGAIYGFAAPSRLASRLIGEWNDLEIQVIGQDYVVTLNGELVTTHAGSRLAKGFVGVQNHHQGSLISFRNIRIREVP